MRNLQSEFFVLCSSIGQGLDDYFISCLCDDFNDFLILYRDSIFFCSTNVLHADYGTCVASFELN